MKQLTRRKSKQHTQGIALVVISSFFYGTYGIWSRLMGDDFGAFSQSAIKAILVVLFLLPLAVRTHKLQRVSLKKNAKWLAVSLLSSILTGAPIYYAMNTIGIGLSLVVFYACFFIAMQIFDYFDESRLPFSREVFTIIMALSGIILVYKPDSSNIVSLGFLAAMVSGFGTGANVLASKKIKANSTMTALIAWMGGVIATIPIAFLLSDAIPPLSSTLPWLYILIFAVCSVASSLSVIHAVKILKTGLVGLIGLLEIVFGIIFGVLFFSKEVTSAMVIGSILIIVAAALPNLYELTQKKGVKG